MTYGLLKFVGQMFCPKEPLTVLVLLPQSRRSEQIAHVGFTSRTRRKLVARIERLQMFTLFDWVVYDMIE